MARPRKPKPYIQKGYFDVEVDGETYGVKGKMKTKTTKGGKTVSKVKGKTSFGAEVDGEVYGVKGRLKTKTTKGGKTVSKVKAKGTGYANPVKKIKDKKVTKNGVVTVDDPKTKYRTKEQVAKRVKRSYKRPFKK